MAKKIDFNDYSDIIHELDDSVLSLIKALLDTIAGNLLFSHIYYHIGDGRTLYLRQNTPGVRWRYSLRIDGKCFTSK